MKPLPDFLLSHAYGARSLTRKAAKATALAFSVWIAGSSGALATERLAALGDSLTHGYGLIDQDGLVPQLQNWLTAQGEDVIVMNAGVSGDTTAGGLARLDWTLTPEVSALMVALGGNDLLRGIDPASSRANLEDIVRRAKERGLPVLLIGMPAPGNYGPEYKAEFDAIFPDLAEKYGVLMLPSFFAGLGSEGDLQDVQEYFQPDGIHPNEKGVKKIVEYIGPTVQQLLGQIE